MISRRFYRFFRHLTPATIQQVIVCSARQRLPGLAAEMAYNSMLGLFPAILTIITAIGLFASLQNTLRNIVNQLSTVAPDEVQFLIGNFVREVSQARNQSLFSLSFVFSLWGFSGVLSAAMSAFDRIQEVPTHKMRSFWQARLVSLVLAVGTIVLLVFASSLVFVSNWAVHQVATQSGALGFSTVAFTLLSIWRWLSLPLALVIVSAAFAFVYRYGPSYWNPGTPMMPGAVLAAIFWAIISHLFRFYLAHFGNYNRAYGAVGAVIVLLLWLYLSSLMLLIGYQLNVTVGESIRRSQ